MSWKTVPVLLAVSCLLTFGCRRERSAEQGSSVDSDVADDAALIKGKLSDLIIEGKLIEASGAELPKVTIVITNKGSEVFSYQGTSSKHADHCFVEIFDSQRNKAERFPGLGPVAYNPEVGSEPGAAWWDAGVWLTIDPGEAIVNVAEWPGRAGLEPGTYDLRVGFPRVFNQRLAAVQDKRERELPPGSSFLGDLDVSTPGERWVPYSPEIDMNKTAFPSREAWDMILPIADPVYSNIVRFVVPTPSSDDDSRQ